MKAISFDDGPFSTKNVCWSYDTFRVVLGMDRQYKRHQ